MGEGAAKMLDTMTNNKLAVALFVVAVSSVSWLVAGQHEQDKSLVKHDQAVVGHETRLGGAEAELRRIDRDGSTALRQLVAVLMEQAKAQEQQRAEMLRRLERIEAKLDRIR